MSIFPSSMATTSTTTAGVEGAGGIIRRTEDEDEESGAVRSPYTTTPTTTSSALFQQQWELSQQEEDCETEQPQQLRLRQESALLAGTRTTTTAGDESAEADHNQVSDDCRTEIRRVETDSSGLIGTITTRVSEREEGRDDYGSNHHDGDDSSGQPNFPPLAPTTPTMMDVVNDPQRRASDDDLWIKGRESYYEWMRNRLANGGDGGGGGGGGGPEGTIARKPRVGDHHLGSLRSYYSGQAMATTTMMMMKGYRDYSCCRKLPDHLIESVLARLPVQSVFRFRSVCRTWNSLLHSPTFLRAYLEAGAIRPQNVWFLVVTANLGRLGRYGHRIVATYDPQCNNWHCIPLPAPLCNLNPFPTAADGGLVCYFVYENRLRTLFVCNPVTKSLRKLPLVLKTSSHISVLKMVMEDRATSSYKVFVAGMVPGENGNDSLSMEVYDSASDCWSTSGIIPARYPKRRPVYVDGVLYLRCSDQRSLLLTYDLKVGLWNKIHAPLPHTLGIEELVQYQGHILLVGVLGENYKIDSVCIWELVMQNPQHSGNVAWKQVDSMPRDMFMEFFCDREYFECQEDERVLMKCCQYGDLILCVASISHRGPFKVLAYDLAQKRWRRLPDSFKARECRTHKFIEGIIYEPRLDVVA